MKRLLGILAALVAVLAITVPAAAQVNTSVEVLAGGSQGNAPDVAVSWVMPDDNPNLAGTQILPPLVKGAKKDVWYFALVDDRQGDDDVANVDVDVWHPTGSPAPYNANSYLKYERTMVRFKSTVNWPAAADLFEEHAADYWFNQAIAAGVLTPDNFGINPNTQAKYTTSEISYLIGQQSIGFYAVKVWIDYEQPAGTYPVRIRAVDKVNNISDLNYSFYYIPVSMVDFDFNAINFGKVMVNTTQEIDGDFEFAAQDGTAGYGTDGTLLASPAQATVRNIGNVWSKITVRESNLSQNGLPLPKDPAWNVVYDACVSDPDADNPKSVFSPEETVTLSRTLFLSETQKMDFSLQFKKYGQTGVWTGTMQLGNFRAPSWPTTLHAGD